MKGVNISLVDFDFRFTGYGHYKVTYRSPVTGKEWTKTTTNMPLIDLTKNAESPKKVDLIHLRRLVKAE